MRLLLSLLLATTLTSQTVAVKHRVVASGGGGGGGVVFKQSVSFASGGSTQSFTPLSSSSVLCAAANTGNPITSNVSAISDSVNGSWTVVDSNDASFSSLRVFCVKNTTTSAITITYTQVGSTVVLVGEWSSVNASFPGTLASHANAQLLAGTAVDANTGTVTGSSGDEIVVFGGNYYAVTTWAAGATNPAGITTGAHLNQGTGNGNIGLFYANLSGSYSAAVGVNPGAAVINYTNVIGFTLPH